MKQKLGSKIYLTLIMGFFYLPIVYVVFFSFNSSKSLSKFTGFSFKWYEQMFASKTMIEAIYYTFVIAIIATFVSTIIGTLASIGLSKSRKVLREVVTQVNNLPIMNPEIVTAIGFMLLYTSLRIEKGFMTLLLAHIVFCIPYVMLSVTPRLRRLDPNLAEAAMDLGASPFYALRKVIIPQLMPGIIAGALIAFTMSFDDFIISYFVSGNGVNNISIMVYTMAKRVNPTINALSTIIVLMITIVLIFMNVLSLRKKKHNKKTSRAIFVAVGVIISLGVYGLNTLRVNNTGSFDPMKAYGCNTLNVFNWGEYIGDKTISDFEKKFNVSVNYSVFASNEEMYTKMLGGENYDILIPSDYMIERLIQEELLRKIDLKNIPNYTNLTSGVLNLEFDPTNEYSIPYLWGSVGIIYDKTKVDAKDVESMGYNVLKDSKYKGRLYIYDSERDSFMMALKSLSYSMNTSNKAELQEAYDWLVDLKQNNDPVFVTDEVIDGMVNNEKDLAVVYSGDAAYIQSENPNMVYFEPLEGTNIWSDAMVIPKNSTCPLLAEEFINYNLDHKVAKNNSEFVGYTSGVDQAMKELMDSDFKGNDAYIPRIGYEKDEIFGYNKKTKKLLSEMWIKIKALK